MIDHRRQCYMSSPSQTDPPVPLPAAVILFGAGLVALVVWSRIGSGS